MIIRILSLFIILYMHVQIASCQEIRWQKINRIAVRNLDLLSTDRRDHIFSADNEGNIWQYSAQGDSLNFYSPVFRAKLTKLEAFWTTTIFLFSADLQKYELLDRFLNPIASNRLNDNEMGVVRHATFGNANVLWMLNESRLSLMKWDFKRNQILQEQPLSLILPTSNLKVLDMIERKNLFFLQLAGAGLFIFDNQGNFIRHLASIPDSHLFISEDDLYYISDGLLLKTNYILEKTTSYNIPDTIYKKIAVTKQSFIFYGENGIDIYSRPTGL
jgi:hypothetical protein